MREMELFAEGLAEQKAEELRRGIDLAWLTAAMIKADKSKFPKDPAELYPKRRVIDKMEAARITRERMDELRDRWNAQLKRREKNKKPPEVKRVKRAK